MSGSSWLYSRAERALPDCWAAAAESAGSAAACLRNVLRLLMRMIDDEREPVICGSDLAAGLDGLAGLGMHVDSAAEIYGSVGRGVRGVGSDHGAAIGKTHLSQVFDLAGPEVVSDEVRRG